MPKDDLYKILGVPSNADKKAIKKAYRAAAKKSHPDMKSQGGSEKKFALVKKSFDILSDDERRAKYDATGDDSEAAPDNHHSDVVNIIAFAFNMVLQECEQQGQSPLETDLIKAVKAKINKSIEDSRKNIRIQKNMLATDEKISGRFSNDKVGIFEGIVGQRISQLRMSIEKMEAGIANAEQAKEMIKECQYRKDDKPYESPGDAMMRRMGAIAYVSY